MKKYYVILFIFSGLNYISTAQVNNIDKILSNLSDISYIEIEGTENFESTYELSVKQPIDHSDSSKGHFYQRVFLSHKGFNQPTVIVTEGYSAAQNLISEVTHLLSANQLQVEHRFFGISLPETLEYKYLNLKQATADLHHIKQLFDEIYKEKWISTGISKGGATTIIYRYFYPDDVDVSVPYVAPINKALEEDRIYQFLDTIGTDACRENIYKYQKRLLQNKDKIMPLLKFYSLGAQANFNFLSIGMAFEYTVMEYPFSFWQWGHNCDDIPKIEASIENMLSHLIAVVNPAFFSDASIDYYAPHYYQSATELGYYGYETFEFRHLLTQIPTDVNPQATFIPFEEDLKFDGTLLKNLNKWLTTDAHKMIYIYGANDTWSASAVPSNKNVDSEWFMMTDKHHGNARIKNMTQIEKDRLTSTLEKWLSIKINNM